MRQSNIFFPYGSFRLEGAFYLPDNKGTYPAVVLCHPHSLYGGSMDNNVILALGATLISNSIIALMFNFRGVGKSRGKFGDGINERKDVTDAIDWLVSQPEVDVNRVGLVGYSFGAFVSLPVACDDKRIRAMAFISPSLETPQISQLKDCAKPKFIISGDEDSLVPLAKIELLNRKLTESNQVELIPGADHFWWGYEPTIAQKITTFFSTVFQPQE